MTPTQRELLRREREAENMPQTRELKRIADALERISGTLAWISENMPTR